MTICAHNFVKVETLVLAYCPFLADRNPKALVTLKKNSEDPGSNPGWISVYFFYNEMKNSEKKKTKKKTLLL